MAHAFIGAGIAGVGVVLGLFGAIRIVRAPALAARRALAVGVEGANTERYTRGLTDFYRISGAVAVIAGTILLLIPIFTA